MLMKFGVYGGQTIIHIPENTKWEIFCRPDNERGYPDNGLYLIVDGKEYEMQEGDFWSGGDRNIPGSEIWFLHGEVIETIFKKIEENPDLRTIDVTGITMEVLSKDFEKRWIEEGYITLNADGSW